MCCNPLCSVWQPGTTRGCRTLPAFTGDPSNLGGSIHGESTPHLHSSPGQVCVEQTPIRAGPGPSCLVGSLRLFGLQAGEEREREGSHRRRLMASVPHFSLAQSQSYDPLRCKWGGPGLPGAAPLPGTTVRCAWEPVLGTQRSSPSIPADYVDGPHGSVVFLILTSISIPLTPSLSYLLPRPRGYVYALLLFSSCVPEPGCPTSHPQNPLWNLVL